MEETMAEEESNLEMVSKFLLKDNIDLIDRSVWIEGNITHRNFIKFSKQLRLLEITSKDPIKVFINSDGGDVYSMFAYIDRIQDSPNIIKTIGTGLVASAAVPILAAGTERYATVYASIMHHTASYATSFMRLPNAKVEHDQVVKLETRICKYLSEVTKKPASYWSTIGKHLDFYFDVNVAIELGLVEGVYEGEIS